VLLGVLFVVVMIHVLPQTDLLDTAFHENTAPLVVHAQANAAPVVLALSTPASLVLTPGDSYPWVHQERLDRALPESPQLLTDSLRC
jgi:hypothetical protein